MSVDDLTPVTVLTGFLGSGKTTTLSRLLKTREFAGTVAIINEFGEIGLDHLLIETCEERYALLDNGCVCCTVRDDLVETLLRLAARAAAGDLPAFARVVIETTGLADPAPILHSLIADARLAARFRIDGVVTTIDAVNGMATLNAHPQAVKQAAVADCLLLTKTDLADDAGPLRARLAALNPTAEIVDSRDGDVAPAALVGVGLEAKRGGEAAAWFAHAASRFRADGGEISTFCFVFDEPVRWGAFKQWLEYLALLKGENLLRFKGLVRVAEKPETPVVVHGVQHVFHPPRALDRWPDADRRTRLVFITREIPRRVIESTLSKYAGLDVSRPAA